MHKQFFQICSNIFLIVNLSACCSGISEIVSSEFTCYRTHAKISLTIADCSSTLGKPEQRSYKPNTCIWQNNSTFLNLNIFTYFHFQFYLKHNYSFLNCWKLWFKGTTVSLEYSLATEYCRQRLDERKNYRIIDGRLCALSNPSNTYESQSESSLMTSTTEQNQRGIFYYCIQNILVQKKCFQVENLCFWLCF